jgi:hypothetical protein
MLTAIRFKVTVLAATPYKLPAVGTADTCSIIWTPGRTGTVVNPLEGNVPLDPAGNITCGPDGVYSPPLCDEIDGLVSQPAALTDEVVATDGTNCFHGTCLVSTSTSS